MILINASKVVEKGDPKNFIPAAGITRIVKAFNAWRDEEKFAHVVTTQDIGKEDFNISPSRYVDIAEAETHRRIENILADLEVLDIEAAHANAALRNVLEVVGL